MACSCQKEKWIVTGPDGSTFEYKNPVEATAKAQRINGSVRKK